MKTYFLNISFLILILFTVSACGIKDKKTTLEITDPDRHYYPILQGQELDIVYQIENTGSHPLFITDIHTSCGCILVDETSSRVLAAGSKGLIRIKYDSKKNIGYAKHYVTIYANLESRERCEATFDLNIVPDALHTKDYEELYKEYKAKNPNMKTSTDDSGDNLGYYVDSRP